ncbi:Glycosyl transferase [Streptococcus pneumoniae]|uniref:glycosyltransferase family 8 protein n=1 Tax=Streptococcus pneumoniae TaxID=1313 RepID=UPI0005E09198|nr:glycosyltransferase family 8 protein [Streptococcus pneumoniae]CTK62413.1 Glycosyl transferase [Streptococcus pneumoniae]CTK67503.1 Glycosyl transferase [Streptococcus pneumoniae]CTK81195.1 Glycosyl transferase [Streptococcus pneumoniae]CTK89816.1 Glycosyl transferase [Streptococcus pneumoniae]CTL02761.1 Glycosyl transferase [Streptococcus pneumoniae]
MTDKASKKAIVLGADSNYMDKVETTIKSVCSHNRDIRFYIFNSDFPTEWFQLMNKRLSVLNSEIINIKITDDTISHFHLPPPHLSSATYLRYFIPNFVFEKKVLYLDSDIVVTSSLTALFDIDLDGYPLGVVPDIPTTDEEFNSGVLLIDTNRWREEDIYRQLFELTIAHHEHVYGDQGIFNILFKDRWKRLDITYNLQVGVDAHRYYMGDYDWYELFEGVPCIIHYTTENKPWKHFRFNRFRDVWWFYYGLNWNDILLRTHVLKETFLELISPISKHVSIFTNTGDIESIGYLLEKLPDVQFHIVAPTYFSPNVIELQRYSNCYIYPCADPKMKQDIIDKTDICLDINYGPAMDQMLQEMVRRGKTIYSFDCTNHFFNGESTVFTVDELIRSVKELKM